MARGGRHDHVIVQVHSALASVDDRGHVGRTLAVKPNQKRPVRRKSNDSEPLDAPYPGSLQVGQRRGALSGRAFPALL